jgi:hypothetical protein
MIVSDNDIIYNGNSMMKFIAKLEENKEISLSCFFISLMENQNVIIYYVISQKITLKCSRSTQQLYYYVLNILNKQYI